MRKLLAFVAVLLCLTVLAGCGTLPDVTLNTTAPAATQTPSDNTAATVPAGTQPSASTTTPSVPSETVPSVPATTAPKAPADSSFAVHFIDVGQADAALVLCDGKAMLIDGGNAADSSLIYAYLKQHGISHLDYIVASHGHEDHCAGLSGALNYASVTTAYSPVTDYDTKAFRNFVSNLQKQGVAITVPKHGDTFSLGSAVGTFLGPISPSDEPNNTSLVIRIVYGQTSFLFTGDAEYEEETEILDAGYDISCTVLKVGHHGSSTSTSYRWLRQAAPEYAVISVGTGNDYGHPHEDPLSRLRDAEVKTFRTDMQGHIICTSDGSSVQFAVERNTDADTLAGAGNGGNHETQPPATTAPAQPPATEDSGTTALTYILNTNTMKFHYPDCSSAKQIADKNRQEVTCDRDELIAQGYSPCGRCDP